MRSSKVHWWGFWFLKNMSTHYIGEKGDSGEG